MKRNEKNNLTKINAPADTKFPSLITSQRTHRVKLEMPALDIPGANSYRVGKEKKD